ncbi:MAG: hypothetical protein RLY20_2363 [Verrucomicrobiota bacterium]|jgi:hypothetical protein
MSATPPTIQPLPTKRSWFERHWKWLVPLLGLGAVVALVGFVVFILLIVFGSMKSSDAYQIPVATAVADRRVQAALGQPIKPSFFLSGSVHINGTKGDADLSIPISGPNGKGTIYAVGTQAAGQWTFTTLVVEVAATRERIELSTNTAIAAP